MIDLQINEEQRKKNAKFLKERNVIIPTFNQMKDPTKIPAKIKDELRGIGLWDIHPRNLFRITWKNEPKSKGGGFKGVNFLLLPPALTGVQAKIVVLIGKWFPTGAHKVGATFGCLIPKLVTGQFDPQKEKAVWPSTGNFCRGGAYVASLLGCQSVAILPENMSKERFKWLSKVAGEIIATPGSESNVKEIFDKCWELRSTRKNINIFNQFEELGNALWHHQVTGDAIEQILKQEMKGDQNLNLAGAIYSSGSAGTLSSGNYLKKLYPQMKIAACEALQCPTLLQNGFGDHRIEGIGDKHVPWIHDVKNTDLLLGIDDEHTIRLLRLFNEKKGQKFLVQNGCPSQLVNQLNLLGISSIGNIIGAIKFSKYFELTDNDYVVTVATDSMELYASRLAELNMQRGDYSDIDTYKDYELLHSFSVDHMQELSYYDRKRVHNLKYFTWIEQQGRKVEELNRQWYDHFTYWDKTYTLSREIDELIIQFNQLS